MIVVRTPDHELFNYTECEELYNQCKDLVGDDEFNKVIKRTIFYSYYDWNTRKLIGCIYYYKSEGKMFVNAFAERGHHKKNIECFKTSLNLFREPIYAKTSHKTAIMCLLRVGFKKIDKELYRYGG